MSFFRDLEKHSLQTAIITSSSDHVSYQDLLERADTIGSKIKKRCLLFLVCSNRIESLAGYIGCMRADSALALIHHSIHPSFFKTLLDRYKPEYIYLPKENLELASHCTSIDTFGTYILLKTSYDADYKLHEDLSLLLTTSGSTGSPKFVRLSHKNIQKNAEAIAHSLQITDSSRPITTMPMNYSYGLSIINSHLLQGASLILSEATLMDKLFWESIQNNQATTFGGVPYIYEILKKLRFKTMNLPSLQYITQAGGKLNRELSDEFAEICIQKSLKFYIMYGQTEATARMSYLPWEYSREKLGSIGIAIPGGRFRLENEKGHVIEDSDMPGELVYEGDNVALGYSESCHDLWKGDENKGTLYTGDIAKRDSDDFYYIIGRKKRFLKIYGNRINLDEVEQLIQEAGYDCACSGSDDNLKIYVTKTSDKSLIKNYVSEHTGIHQAALSVVDIHQIPRNEAGKVLYSELN